MSLTRASLGLVMLVLHFWLWSWIMIGEDHWRHNLLVLSECVFIPFCTLLAGSFYIRIVAASETKK